METPCDNTNNKHKLFMGLALSSQKELYVYILSLILSASDADDILQDVLALMWTKFDEFRPGTDFVAWGKTIARYKVMNFLRKTKASKLHYNSDVLEMIESKSSQTQNLADHKKAMQGCLKKLSENYMGVLRMRYIHDMTFKQMSLKLGVSKQSVHRTVSRIHALLVKCINQVLSGGEAYGK